MNHNEYLTLSEKTLSTNFNCNSRSEKNLAHAVIGIATEVEELIVAIEDAPQDENGSLNIDGVNFREELGDILWYLAIASRELNFTYAPEDVDLTTIPENGDFFAAMKTLRRAAIGGLLDQKKKNLFYNKVESVVDTYKTVYNMVYVLAAIFHGTPEAIMKTNIDKLAFRYGDKFSEYLAENRRLDEERAILESGTDTASE